MSDGIILCNVTIMSFWNIDFGGNLLCGMGKSEFICCSENSFPSMFSMGNPSILSIHPFITKAEIFPKRNEMKRTRVAKPKWTQFYWGKTNILGQISFTSIYLIWKKEKSIWDGTKIESYTWDNLILFW